MDRLCALIILNCCWILLLTACSASMPVGKNTQLQNSMGGISLYEEYCASCHRSFAKTTKPQRSLNRLRSSIVQFPAMSNLDFLSDAQLEAISASLATVPLQRVSRRN